MILEAKAVDTLERATFDAVPPELTHRIGQWLLGLDHGTVGRAHSAVPMQHDRADVESLPQIEARYVEHGLTPVFRVPALPVFDPVCVWLQDQGYVARKPTRTLIASVADMLAATADAAPIAKVQLLSAPDDGWRDLFLGEGFDVADGASRVKILARAHHAVYACVRVDGQTVAAGLGSFSRGWGSVHGMRTLPAHRNRGHSRSILRTLAHEAQARGMERMFLQVESANTGAQALYRRVGFGVAWEYAYWARDVAA